MDFWTILLSAIGLVAAFRLFRNIRRKTSLRQLEDGRYSWREWHGGRRVSDIHPNAHFGAWTGGAWAGGAWGSGQFDQNTDVGGLNDGGGGDGGL